MPLCKTQLYAGNSRSSSLRSKAVLLTLMAKSCQLTGGQNVEVFSWKVWHSPLALVSGFQQENDRQASSCSEGLWGNEGGKSSVYGDEWAWLSHTKNWTCPLIRFLEFLLCIRGGTSNSVFCINHSLLGERSLYLLRCKLERICF